MRVSARWASILVAVLQPPVLPASPSLHPPFVANGPDLRGDLSSPAWRQGEKVSGFTLIDSGEAPSAPTDAWVLRDRDHLYVAFVCHDPAVDRLVTETSGHDGPVTSDDCVELIIDPTNGDTWCYHIAANSSGVHWDARHAPVGTSVGYASGVTASGKAMPDRWVCELRVPFGGLGGAPQPGEVWGINLCRTRRTSPEPELTSWAAAPRGFAVAETCGDAVFAAAPGPVTVNVLSRGGVCADTNETGANVFVLQARNAGEGAAEVKAEVALSGRVVAVERELVPPGQSRQVRVRYLLPSEGQPLCGFSVSVNGDQAYASQIRAMEPTYRGPRTWQVANPLFEELLGGQPPGYRQEGTLFWGHLNNVSILRETARRFAVRYTEEDAYREHAEHRLILIGHGVVRDLNHPHPIARWRVRNAPIPGRLPEGVPWVLDPRAIEANMVAVEEVFAGPHPLVFCVFAGDEVEDIAIKQGVALMARPGDYAYIRQADEEVRREFGGGTWGIPAGSAERDPNPFKWIAFRRWVNSRLRERHRQMRGIVKHHAPKLPFLSTDSGGLVPLEWSQQAELFDIFTIQTRCLGSPWRAQPGCITKVIADLTGKEFWPCVHIENYGMNTTPQEAVEELSQVFRNGATGLHLYMPDTANARKQVGDTRVSYFGSPRRWHTVTNILDLLRTMPRPCYPPHERTAILFNDDTLQAIPYDAYRPYTDQTEACYTFLGPVARSWFRFVDCGQLLRWPSLAERLDVLFVPCARHQRTQVYAKLREFVHAGGTLICGDSHAFETDLLGNDTSGARRELFGVDVGDPVKAKAIRPAFLQPPPHLAIGGEAHRLTPDPGVEVLATYGDGTAAMTCSRVGEGRAVLFGTNPFSLDAVPDAAWRAFFTDWLKQLGAPTGLDIWRFRFPESVIWREPEEPGLCLTNNRVLWQEEVPRFTQNAETGGSYSYSLPPDAMPDAGLGVGAVPFTRGHLTDRGAGVMARKLKPTGHSGYALPASRWLVQWVEPSPVSITFDLRTAWTPLRLKLWFCDTLPPLAVEGSVDGTRWQELSRANGQHAGSDVFDLVLDFRNRPPCRYLRLSLDARREGDILTLVEVEIWGRDTEGK